MATLLIPGHLPLIQADQFLRRELKFCNLKKIHRVSGYSGCIAIEYEKMSDPEIIAELNGVTS